MAPRDLVEKRIQGIDSCVVQFATGGCELTGDFGGYSDSLSPQAELTDYVVESVRVGKHEATLVRYARLGGEAPFYLAGVHFPLAPREPLRLTVTVQCPSARQRDEAAPVLRTVRLLPFEEPRE